MAGPGFERRQREKLGVSSRLMYFGKFRASSMHNLDDPTQTSLYIPYQPPYDNEADNNLQKAYIAAYKLTWAKCSTQLRLEIDKLYKPTLDAIVDRIATAHEDVLPGLPCQELPLIAVHNSSSLFIDALIPRLSTESVSAAISHIYPSDAPNISVAMRSLISNFLDPSTMRKSKLAAYDIGLLDSHFTSSDSLLVVLHDFEHFEPNVMQDVLHICSTRIPSLHLTFLAFLSSPSTPSSSYIHAAYPRSTLTRLRVHSLSVQGGTSVLEELLLRTFFDPGFEPDVVLGSSAVEGIVDYYTRHNGSIDGLITSIQLAHLKHFLTEPLSILVHPPSTFTTDRMYTPILSLLHSRIPSATSETLFDTFMQHSAAFRTFSRALRIGFMILHKTSNFLLSNGYKPFQSSRSSFNATTSLMLSTLRGQTAREVKTLLMYVKKLRPDTLRALLTELHDVYPDGYDSAKDQVLLFLSRIGSGEGESEDEFDTEEVSTWFSNHLTSLLKPLTQHPLWDIYYTGSSPFPADLLNPSLRATVISALIHPYSFILPLPLPTTLTSSNPLENDHTAGIPASPTVSEIETRLKSTHIPENNGQQNKDEIETEIPKELHKLPDTSILFARYLDSGKLINIYDWYESFKVCLDAQRTERISRISSERTSRKGKGKGRKSKSQSPTKKLTVKKKGKGKAKATDEEQEEVEVAMDVDTEIKVEEPDEEAWQREVQARFIRALHELDYLGFIKHTGRKVEHVARVVFDVGDGDDGGEEEEEEK